MLLLVLVLVQALVLVLGLVRWLVRLLQRELLSCRSAAQAVCCVTVVVPLARIVLTRESTCTRPKTTRFASGLIQTIQHSWVDLYCRLR